MATHLQNLSSIEANPDFDYSKYRFGVVVAEWNREITQQLEDGVIQAFSKYGITHPKQVSRIYVPGSFELTTGALWLAKSKKIHAVIALGCLIKGDTPHFEYISQAVSVGLTQVAVETQKPVIFGVITTLTQEQALDRAGGKHGNKGYEAAVTALRMIEARQLLANQLK